ncbi:hypothetical protein A3727_21035 [Erythrobacter sp. HI0038]|nr:hypothetical protein A3727_21035 [Erythrobacter sp. HI0038]
MDPCEAARLDAAASSAQGVKELTPEWARPLVDQIRDALSDEYVSAALKAIGATPSESNIAAARTHMIRAGASASARAQRVFDEDVLEAADPMRAMMADLGELSAEVKALLSKAEGLTAPAAPTTPPPPSPTTECPFAIYDNRRFSEIIEDTLATLKRKKVWKDDKQQRMILQCFAWMTGDRELGRTATAQRSAASRCSPSPSATNTVLVLPSNITLSTAKRSVRISSGGSPKAFRIMPL